MKGSDKLYSTKQLGINVREARRYRSKKSGIDFSQKALAVKIGETSKWVKRLENGEFYPDWEALNFITDICGVDLEILTGEKFRNGIEYEEAIKDAEVAGIVGEEELRV